jgi:hypothetical protein
MLAFLLHVPRGVAFAPLVSVAVHAEMRLHIFVHICETEIRGSAVMLHHTTLHVVLCAALCARLSEDAAITLSSQYVAIREQMR